MDVFYVEIDHAVSMLLMNEARRVITFRNFRAIRWSHIYGITAYNECRHSRRFSNSLSHLLLLA